MSHEPIIFGEESHSYTVNGRSYPGVTSILKDVGLTPDFSKIAPDVLEYKRILGTEVHRVIELDLQDDLGDYDPVLEPYVSAWRKFRDDLKIVPIQTECPIYSAAYGYCGKLDLLAKSANGEGLFDFKTATSVDTFGVGPQLSGYDIGWREWSGQPKRRPYPRYAVKLMNNGKYKLIKCDDPNDANIFLYAVQIYHWKRLKHKTG